jgi:hypothetical protein
MITAIHVGSFGCGQPAFLLTRRLRRDTQVLATAGRWPFRDTVAVGYVGYQGVTHIDGTPYQLNDRLICDSCGDWVDIGAGDISQEVETRKPGDPAGNEDHRAGGGKNFSSG